MEKQSRWMKILLMTVSYILVAVLASAVTLFFFSSGTSKLEQLQDVIQQCFIGEVDATAMEDAAAAAMVDAIGDRWSYYIPASEYGNFKDQKANSYVGVGMTIAVREDNTGFDITQVEPNGAAKEAGIVPGDILVEVEGQKAVELGTDGTAALVRGEEGTTVSVTILRDGQQLPLTLTRKRIQVVVTTGQLLEQEIGLVTIANFNDNCAAETKAVIEDLLTQGAKALIFDVRFNPGGYQKELVDILNYLLPEGTLFRSQYYTGEESIDKSDADCLQMPMAVLINGSSYSAAEFFAAALHEYDWAVLVGEPTIGKGYFQTTMKLLDGSAVNLSVGKYYTPNGINLTEAGGLTPDVPVETDLDTAAKIYAKVLQPEEDPQIQAAVKALLEK